MKKTILLLLLFLPPAFAQTSPIPVDILITGGTVITLAGNNIQNGSVVIRDDKIVAVGQSELINADYKAKLVIDAKGSAVLPGFVNAHTHVPMTLLRGIADDLSLMDWLQHYIFPAESKLVDQDFVKWGTRLAAIEMIQSGTTTFADMYFYESEIAKETKAAGLRAVLGAAVIDMPAPDNKTWDAAIINTQKFIKQWQHDPLITPAIAPHSVYTVSQKHLQEVRQLATEMHVPILIHLSETQDELKQISQHHQGMTPGQYLNSFGFLDKDVVAAHGVWLTPTEIETMAKHNTGVVHCPQSNQMLASGIAPIAAMRKASMHVGLGTDGTAGSNNNLDMIDEMASAARLQKVSTGDPKALSARDVLEMATIEGARVLGLADKIGTLEMGKQADVIIIDLQKARLQPIYSVESAIVYAGNGGDVVTTICNGKILMQNRQILTVNVTETINKAKWYRDQVRLALGLKPSGAEHATIHES